MSNAQKHTRRQIKDLVVANAMRSEAYRAGLQTDPKAMVEKQLGRLLPENFKVELLYEDKDTLYVVLPPNFPEDEDWEEDMIPENKKLPATLTLAESLNGKTGGAIRRAEGKPEKAKEEKAEELETVEALSEADLENIAGGFAETHVNSCLGSGSMTSNA